MCKLYFGGFCPCVGPSPVSPPLTFSSFGWTRLVLSHQLSVWGGDCRSWRKSVCYIFLFDSCETLAVHMGITACHKEPKGSVQLMITDWRASSSLSVGSHGLCIVLPSLTFGITWHASPVFTDVTHVRCAIQVASSNNHTSLSSPGTTSDIPHF